MTVRKSIALASAGNYASIVISFAANVIIARKLTPEEFGLFAIAMASTGILTALRESGVNAYIIQHDTADRATLQAAFTAVLAISAAAGALLLALAPAAAAFFEADSLRHLLWIIAIGFAAHPFSATIAATLQREMRFETLLAINVSSSLVHSATALSLVFAGYGVLSLAIAAAVASIYYAIACLVIERDRTRFRIHLAGVPEVMRFSVTATAALLLRQARNDSFPLIAGRMLGAAAVGLTGRAGALLGLYNKLIAGIYPVVLPAFSAHKRSGGDLAPALLRGQALLNLTAMGAYGFFLVAGEPAIVFLYGEQWRPAADLLAPMMFSALVGASLDRLATPIYLAHGRVDIILKIQAVMAPLKIVVLVIATPFGLMPALWAITGLAVLQACADLWFLPKLVGTRPHDLIAVFGRALMVAAPAVLVGTGLQALADAWELAVLPNLLLVGPVYAAVFLATAALARHPLAEELARLARAGRARLFVS